jgi:hypothetical protein
LLNPGVHTESIKGKSYAPKGKTPTIFTTGSRLVKNYIAAIANDGLVKYKTYFNSMNCKVFINFLKGIVKSSKGTVVFAIVDNLKVHHGKMVTAWLKEHSNEIQVFYLPSYCPDLNPEEYFNHLVKQQMHSLPQPKTKDELSSILGGVLRRLQKSPGKIMSLFENKNIKYAAKDE